MENRRVEKEALVIDTGQYSGSFEREMFAYITGQEYEYETGYCPPLREAAVAELPPDALSWFESHLAPQMSSRGNLTPVEIHPTPGFFNNGVGKHFQPGQETKAIKHRQIYCLGESEKSPYKDDAANESHKQFWIKRSEEPLTKFPAYQSVAIYLDEKPPASVLRIAKERAYKFCVDGCHRAGYRDDHSIELLGVRWVTFYSMTESEPV